MVDCKIHINIKAMCYRRNIFFDIFCFSCMTQLCSLYTQF